MTQEVDEYVQCIYLTVINLEDAKAASGKKLKTIW